MSEQPSEGSSERPSEGASRYERSTSSMAGALLVTVLAVIGFVAFRGCNRAGLDVQPDHIDYRAQVGYAQEAGATLVYPARLPTGWYATRVDYEPGTRPELGLSLLTPDNQYVGVRQSPVPIPELLTSYVDPAPAPGRPVTLEGAIVRRWDTWTDAGGDTALVARWHRESLLVFGSVPLPELEGLVRSLTTKKA